MACPLPRPTLDALWTQTANQFSANVLGGAPIIPESNEHYVVSNDVLVKDAIYAVAERQWKETDDRQNCCDNLVARAARRGVYPYPARRAQGYVTLTGTALSVLPSTMQFSLGGTTYEVAPGQTPPSAIGSDGKAVVPIVAQTAGASSNTVSTTTGTLLTTIAGVDTAVTLCGSSLCGGRDAETCDEFRVRYLSRIAYKPVANLQWAIDALRDGWPCVTRVAVRNCGCCTEVYKVELYPFMDSTFANGIVPDQIRSDMQDWLFGNPQGLGLGKVPFGVFGQLYSPTTAKVDVVVTGLECVSSTTIEAVKTQITSIFTNRVPGELLCLRTVDLAVAQIIGNGCNFSTSLEPATGATGLSLTSCGDIQPDCDVMPVLGVINTSTSYCG